jgi:hypothetical protein
MLDSTSEILRDFNPIGLDGTMNVRFMSRIDTKYVFPVSKLPILLGNVKSFYHILEIDKQRDFTYRTVYFDTPELLFYKQHVTGKLNRNKVRVRTYEANSLTFLEVKHKSNKGVTSKTRMPKKDNDPEYNEKSHNFLRGLIETDTDTLKAMITTGSTRITLVNLSKAERITIDYNILWDNLRGERIEMPFLAIAEIKNGKSTSQSPFFQQLKKLGIRRTGFSKYAVGMSMLYPVQKRNAIKPKLLLINKIRNEYNRNGVA